MKTLGNVFSSQLANQDSKQTVQGVILGFGLLACAFACVYVPYHGILLLEGDNAKAFLGYHFIWSPPNAVEICTGTFRALRGYEHAARLIGRCSAALDVGQSLLAVVACGLTTFSAMVLVNVFWRKRMPSLSRGSKLPPRGPQPIL